MKKFIAICLIMVFLVTILPAKTQKDLLQDHVNLLVFIYLKDFQIVGSGSVSTNYYYYIFGTLKAVEDDYIKIYGILYEYEGGHTIGSDPSDSSNKYYYIPLSNIAFLKGSDK